MRKFIGVLVVAAAVLLRCGQLQAQVTNTITSASLSSLQDALVSGANVILLQFSTTLATTTPLEIVEDVTIDGTGFTPEISGGGTSQIFIVDPDVTLTMINVTLSGGNNTGAAGIGGTTGGNGGNTGGNGGSGTAGTNAFGGAVYNQGTSTFVACLFLTNGATGGAGGAGGAGGNGNNTGGTGGNGGNGGIGQGGAIYNLGTLVVSNCTIAGNTATGGAGGVGGTNGAGVFASYPGAGGAGGAAAGAGIFNAGTAIILNSTLNQNISLGGTSQKGGGPTGSSQTGSTGANGGSSQGGGLWNVGTNTLVNCTFFANNATGGIGGDGGNGSTGGTGGNGGNGGNAFGGGMFNAPAGSYAGPNGIYNAPGGVITITNCTITSDVVTGGTNGIAGFGTFAGKNGSVGSVGGANLYNGNSGATFLLKNSILDFPTNATSALGTIIDQGFNLSSDATPIFTKTNSFNNKDPKLSPTGLAGNGSTTVLTIGLSANSPAVNAITDFNPVTNLSAPTNDERGFVRPGQTYPCIGAYEFGSQFTSYDVTGVVTLSGRPLSGVTVTAGAIASTVTSTNGTFQFSLFSTNPISIHANPSAFFNPSAQSVIPTNAISNLVFNATNAVMIVTNAITNASGGYTNTNSLSIPFIGIPNYVAYTIQGTTNFLPTNTVWTNLVINNSGTPTGAAFIYTNTGTNLTNFHYFHAKLGTN